MSRTWVAAIFFTAGLTAGVLLALRLRPNASAAGQSLDLRIQSGGTYRVRSVIDGDTVVLENGLHLRYSGVNAPESGRFVKDPAPKSSDSTERNRALVEGKEVRIELAREPLDLYGRALGRVYIKEGADSVETDVGEKLVREGLARAMNLGLSDAEWTRLKEAQDAAKNDGVGVWGLSATESGTPNTDGFVASGGSAIYHAAECSIAKRIRAENRRSYATREAAEAAGLKACETCRDMDMRKGKLGTE